MFPGVFGLVDVFSICCVEETNGVVDGRTCPFVVVFSIVLFVLIVGPSVLDTVDVDVDEVVVDSLILGDFGAWLLIVFSLVFTVGPFVVVIVKLDVVVVADSVEMFDFVVLLAFITVTVDCVVGNSVVDGIFFVVISVVDGLIVVIAAELFSVEILAFGGVDDVVLVWVLVVTADVGFVEAIAGFVVDVESVIELSAFAGFNFVVMWVVGLPVLGVAVVVFVVGVAAVVFVVGIADDDNDEVDNVSVVVDFVNGLFVLADFCVVVPVIELAVDVRDDDIVDGEDAPSVVELVCVAYKRNHLLCKFEFWN